jgi:hypothetical protein
LRNLENVKFGDDYTDYVAILIHQRPPTVPGLNGRSDLQVTGVVT